MRVGGDDRLRAVGGRQHQARSERGAVVEVARRVAEVEALGPHALALAGQHAAGSQPPGQLAGLVELAARQHPLVALVRARR